MLAGTILVCDPKTGGWYDQPVVLPKPPVAGMLAGTIHVSYPKNRWVAWLAAIPQVY